MMVDLVSYDIETCLCEPIAVREDQREKSLVKHLYML